MIRLRIDPRSLEFAPCFVALTVFAEEDLPLNGVPGRIDKLLGKEASRQIEAGNLSGAWESQALLATRDRIEPRYVLFAGLGLLRRITVSSLSVRIEEIVQRMLKFSTRDIARDVFHSGKSRVRYENLASETLSGAVRGVENCPYDVNITVCEPEPSRYNELVAVAEKNVFRRREGRELSVEIIV